MLGRGLPGSDPLSGGGRGVPAIAGRRVRPMVGVHLPHTFLIRLIPWGVHLGFGARRFTLLLLFLPLGLLALPLASLGRAWRRPGPFLGWPRGVRLTPRCTRRVPALAFAAAGARWVAWGIVAHRSGRWGTPPGRPVSVRRPRGRRWMIIHPTIGVLHHMRVKCPRISRTWT